MPLGTWKESKSANSWICCGKSPTRRSIARKESSHMDPENSRAFSFLRMNHRPGKPRRTGITEIRGPYYTPMGKRYLQDVLETMGAYVDSLKFAGGSFTLMPEKQLREIIDLAHRYNVLVSTGGFIEHVLTQGS